MARATVVLRDFRAGDAEDAAAVQRWFNNDEVAAGLVGSRDNFDLEAARGWVERAADTAVGNDDRKWAITIDGNDRAVGFVALFGIGRTLGPELAVLIGEPEAWGKGVAREAERQACQHAFGDYGVHRLHAEILATNIPAQKVVTYLGFRQEGLLKKAVLKDGSYIDNQIWGCLPEDFAAAEAARSDG